MISIVGTINCSFSVLTSVLKKTLQQGLVKDKSRVFGEEITYSDSKLELYIYSLNCKERYDNAVDDYQFECKYSGSKIDAGILVLNVGENIRIKGYMSVFEIGECDEIGNSENDDIVIRFVPNR